MSQPLFVRQLTRAERAQIDKLRKNPATVAMYRRAQAVYLSSRGRTVHL